MSSIKFLIFVSVTVCFFDRLVTLKRSFTVDYENNSFLKDGEPFRYVSGSIHYFRVPSQFWYDRLYKMKMAGLNTIQTYVEWSQHEPEPGVYSFSGNNDLVKFLQTALKLDLLVILRTGPFIDAERDMGGFPYWLMRVNPEMKLRSYDQSYIKYVDRWYAVLLPLIRPLLYHNGGPIISVQVENEFGSYGTCDAAYTTHLRDMLRYFLSNEVVLFTTDGNLNEALMCGKVDEVLSTVDYGTGSDVKSIFEMLRLRQSSGPLVNSEFYSGWLDHWGEPHAQVEPEAVAETLNDILAVNASVNIYMFHGGTSFGFSAGSNLGAAYQACPTSYDYDAPLSEAGDPTIKYYSIRSIIGKFMPLPPGPVPEPSPKMEFGPLYMKKIFSVWDYVLLTSEAVASSFPLSFEYLKQPYGFVIYQTKIQFNPTDPALLSVTGLRDRGHVFINKEFQGILSREMKIFSMPLKIMQGQELSILVENQGRICFGSEINDRKGIIENVTLGTEILLNWTMISVDLSSGDSLDVLEKAAKDLGTFLKHEKRVSSPALYSGQFTLPTSEPLDTFLNVDGWHKGIAILNGFNLGRYWPIVGPQITLYTPSVFLRKPPEINTLILFELEHAPCKTQELCTVQFVQQPNINATTPVLHRAHKLFIKR